MDINLIQCLNDIIGGVIIKKWILAVFSIIVVIILLLALILISIPESEKKKEEKERINAVIITPKEGEIFSTNDDITFSADTSQDLDNEFSYVWSSNISGGFGYRHIMNYKLVEGNHQITLKVISENGFENISVVNITVYPIPYVIIDSPTIDRDYYSTELIIFNGSNSTSKFSSKLNYTWTSDVDGVLGNSKIITTKLSLGTHTITLEVYDGLSKNQEQLIIEVIQNNPPIAAIKSPKYNEIFLLNSAIFFDGSSCFDPDHHTLFFNWTSNLDGLIGTEESFYITLSPGTHIIVMEVNDNYGCSAEISTVLTVNTPPTADAGFDLQVELGEKVIFDGSNSSDADGDELIFSWDFGDGNKSIGEKVYHTFQKEGIYNVTLTVDDGKKGIEYDYIEVKVIYIFRGPGIYGYVYNNKTLEPIKGMRIYAEKDDWYDYFYNITYSNNTGYYEFYTPEGYIWLRCYSDKYYTYYANVSVSKKGIVRKDIYLDPIPPRTAKVFGYVYDNLTKEPIYDADVELYDDKGFYNLTYTDEFGYYELKAPPGEFILYCYAWDWDIDYVSYVVEITLKDHQNLRYDIYLKRTIPDENNISYEFSSSNWDRVTQTYRTIIYSYTQYIRSDMDENDDGEVTESEVSLYELEMETWYEIFYADFTTDDSFMVDNITYKYVTNSVDIEFKGAVGPVTSENPITAILKMDLKSNHTIPISDSHNVQLIVNYDDSSNTYIYYIKFPNLFEMTNYTEEVNISISGSNLVRIDPTAGPDWWYWEEEIILEVTRKV